MCLMQHCSPLVSVEACIFSEVRPSCGRPSFIPLAASLKKLLFLQACAADDHEAEHVV